MAAAAVLAFGVAAMAASAPARAQALRIAVVNYALLLQKSPQAQAASAELRKEFEPKQRSLQSQAHQLQLKQAQLKRNAATMTQDQRNQAELSLREQYQQLAQQESELQDSANNKRNELMSQVTHTLVQVVQNYARTQHFNLVLADGVIYADSALDITPQILRALSTRAPAPRTPK